MLMDFKDSLHVLLEDGMYKVTDFRSKGLFAE
jgi:hypothetical protein